MATTPNRSWPTPDDNDLVRDGAAAIRALGDAIDGTVGQGFVYAGTRYYESSGQFEKADPLGTGDIGLRAIRVRLVGGGGGAGGVAATGANEAGESGGGGGGGYAEAFITDIAGIAGSETVARGAGGSGGTAGNNAGSVGGTSSFGSLVVAAGGSGGGGGANTTTTNVNNGGGGGTGTTGDLLISGGPGVGGRTDLTLTLATFRANTGGNSMLGSGGQAFQTGLNSDGFAGQLYGGGAAGARSGPSQSARPGLAGGNGIVIVDCFV